MRCFLSIELSNETINELVRIQKELGPFLNAKFVEPENLHLALKFFGEVDEKDVKDIVKNLREIKFPKFSVFLGKMGFFPNEALMRVLWVGLESEKVHELYNQIEDNLVAFKDSGFESHVTLARIKSIKNKGEFLKKIQEINIKPLPFEIKDFVLKKSTLTEKGPIYEDVERFNLI